jgi:phage FluMu gp28-like protein
MDVASTPKGRDNLFAELRDNPTFLRSTVTLADAIAAGLKVDAEEIRRTMGDDELYRQEFGCEFLDESSAFLTYEQISRAEDLSLNKAWELIELADGEGPLYCGVDIGRHHDLTVMWVVEDVRGSLLTRGVRESRGEPFREQSAALAELLTLRRVRRCCIDAGGIGMPLAEAATEAFGSTRVEAVTFTSTIKDEMASRLRMRVEEGALRIPVDEAIRNDWHSVRRSVTSVGPARYESGRGSTGHADRFWAACLAVRAAGNGAVGGIEMIRGKSLAFARRGVW